MLLTTINRRLAEQYEREIRARTVLRLVPSEKPMSTRASNRAPRSYPATPPPAPRELACVEIAPLPPLPVLSAPPAESELVELELPKPELADEVEVIEVLESEVTEVVPEPENKRPRSCVKEGYVTVGVGLPKAMHVIFRARATANGTTIKHEVLLSLGRDLG